MKTHLQIAYPNIVQSSDNIELNHFKISNKIKEIMTAKYTPSFQKIVGDEIHSSCPSLKESEDSYLNEHNIYLRTDIFGIIFEILNEKRTLGSFDVERNQLLYNNKTMVLAQGEEAEMHLLVNTIRTLINNFELRKLVEEYKTAYNELINDEHVLTLKTDIDNLYYYIKSGKHMDGYNSCNLCKDMIKPSV